MAEFEVTEDKQSTSKTAYSRAHQELSQLKVELEVKGLKAEASIVGSLLSEADRLPASEGSFELTQDSLDDATIANILSMYEQMHKTSSSKDLVKIAKIRKSNNCPFSLPIPQGCKYAGASTKDMIDDPSAAKENRKTYNEFRTHKPCFYAAKILKEFNSVECNYDTTTPGFAPPEMFSGSPIYPRLWQGFNTVNLDTNYYQYHNSVGGFSGISFNTM